MVYRRHSAYVFEGDDAFSVFRAPQKTTFHVIFFHCANVNDGATTSGFERVPDQYDWTHAGQIAIYRVCPYERGRRGATRLWQLFSKVYLTHGRVDFSFFFPNSRLRIYVHVGRNEIILLQNVVVIFKKIFNCRRSQVKPARLCFDFAYVLNPSLVKKKKNLKK